MGHFLKEHGLPHEIECILIAEHRLGQAGKGGELVDHLAQIPHLPHDRTGQLVEQRPALVAHLGAVAALEALGRKLDRG